MNSPGFSKIFGRNTQMSEEASLKRPRPFSHWFAMLLSGFFLFGMLSTCYTRGLRDAFDEFRRHPAVLTFLLSAWGVFFALLFGRSRTWAYYLAVFALGVWTVEFVAVDIESMLDHSNDKSSGPDSLLMIAIISGVLWVLVTTGTASRRFFQR